LSIRYCSSAAHARERPDNELGPGISALFCAQYRVTDDLPENGGLGFLGSNASHKIHEDALLGGVFGGVLHSRTLICCVKALFEHENYA